MAAIGIHMQTRVYYNPYKDTQTHTCVNVNAALLLLRNYCLIDWPAGEDTVV